jgi:hypothetical protein
VIVLEIMASVPVNEELRRELLFMRAEDLRVREELIKGTSRYDGYNPRMEEVHRRNATRLKQIIAEYGWPGRSLVSEDGAIAAWFIALHAIGDPPFQRKALELQRGALARGDVSPTGPAFLAPGLHFSKTVSAISRGVRRFTERNSKWMRTVTSCPTKLLTRSTSTNVGEQWD